MKRRLRIVHSADWHLGRTLSERCRHAEHVAFCQWLIDLIQREAIDVLIVAGDVFDSANPPHQAIELYYQTLHEISRGSQCQVVVVAGNHDSPRLLQAPAAILRHHRIHVIGTAAADVASMCVTLPSPDDQTPIAIVAAIPYLRDGDLRRSTFGESREAIDAALQEGVRHFYHSAGDHCRVHQGKVPLLATGHLTIAGGSDSGSERAIHIGGLGGISASALSSHFDYVALGHLHRRQSISAEKAIVYSGSPIPLGFGEIDAPRSVEVLTFEGVQLVEQEKVEVPLHRRLIRITARHDDVCAVLKSFSWPADQQTPFVHVHIEDYPAGSNLATEVQRMFEKLTGDLLQLSVQPLTASGDSAIRRATWQQELIRLQNEPLSVFRMKLDSAGIADDRRAALELEFEQTVAAAYAQERDGLGEG